MRPKEGRPYSSIGPLALSLVCLLPVALAVGSAGSLSVGSVTLPPNASNEGPFLGLVYNDASNLSSGSLQSGAVTLCKYEARFTEIAHEEPLLRLPMSVDVQEACFNQTSVTVILDGKPGWIGVRPRIGGTVVVTASARADVEPHPLSDLATENSDVVASDDSRKPRFTHVVSRDHLLYSTPGLVEYQGDGELRFMGPTAHVESAENKTDYRTGVERHGGTSNVHETILRWVVVRYNAATFTLDAATPFLLRALPSQGRATLTIHNSPASRTG